MGGEKGGDGLLIGVPLSLRMVPIEENVVQGTSLIFNISINLIVPTVCLIVLTVFGVRDLSLSHHEDELQISCPFQSAFSHEHLQG